MMATAKRALTISRTEFATINCIDTMKEQDRLGLGVQGDGAQWLAEAGQMLDFNLKRLARAASSI